MYNIVYVTFMFEVIHKLKAEFSLLVVTKTMTCGQYTDPRWNHNSSSYFFRIIQYRTGCGGKTVATVYSFLFYNYFYDFYKTQFTYDVDHNMEIR